MRLQQVTYLSSERPPRVLRQPAPGRTSDHNLSTEVASALDLHRRGASRCPPIAELGCTRLSEGRRLVGAGVVKAAPSTFLERWQLQPPSTLSLR